MSKTLIQDQQAVVVANVLLERQYQDQLHGMVCHSSDDAARFIALIDAELAKLKAKYAKKMPTDLCFIRIAALAFRMLEQKTNEPIGRSVYIDGAMGREAIAEMLGGMRTVQEEIETVQAVGFEPENTSSVLEQVAEKVATLPPVEVSDFKVHGFPEVDPEAMQEKRSVFDPMQSGDYSEHF